MKLPFVKIVLLSQLMIHSVGSFAQSDSTVSGKQTVYGGLRFQKAVGFYWINGISAEYSHEKVLNQKISFAFTLLSSKLGSALGNNAIPYFESNLSAIYHFRNQKRLQPLVRLNTGYARAWYDSSAFDEIPNQSALLSFETGLEYSFNFPFKLNLSGGYNFIYGNGQKGLGVLFPIYFQFSALYRIK